MIFRSRTDDPGKSSFRRTTSTEPSPDFPTVNSDPSPEKEERNHSRFGITRLTSSISSIIMPEKDEHNVQDGCIYRIHHNTVAGLMHGTGTFLTYSIYLFYVEHEFGSLEAPWNQKYAKAVQIFESTPGGMMIRGCIQALHAQLYRRGSTDRTTKGNLHDGDDFIKIFLQGAKQGAVYTYALHNNKFKCSETGINLSKDLTSKHAVHANASPSVRCAGEFHFQPIGYGSYKLILDNNSGTYAPTMNHLDCLKKTLERNFRGLEIETHDYKSDILRSYLDKLRALKQPNSPTSDSIVTDFHLLQNDV